MSALEELINNLSNAGKATNSIVDRLSGRDVRPAREFAVNVSNVVSTISGYRLDAEEEQYVSLLAQLCAKPIFEAASDLKAYVLAGQSHDFLSEYSKLTILTDNILLELWGRRKESIAIINQELERHEIALQGSVIWRKIVRARADADKGAEERALMREWVDGASPGTGAFIYMANLQGRLLASPPDWSPRGAYFPPNSGDWKVSEIGSVMERRKVRGTAGIAFGIGARIGMAFLGVPAFLLPGIFAQLATGAADYLPAGYLSVERNRAAKLEGLRLGASMGNNEKAPFVVDCVYTGRLLGHERFRAEVLKDIALRINSARSYGQFFVQCFVADLRDDTNGEVANTVKGITAQDYSVYVYDYQKKELIYNTQDFKTKAFAGWFKPAQERITGTLDLIGQADEVSRLGRGQSAHYYKVSTLQKRLSSQIGRDLLRIITYHYGNAKLTGDGDAIYFIKQRE